MPYHTFRKILILLLLVTALVGCTPVPEPSQSQFLLTWQVLVDEYQLKDNFQVEEVVSQYNGTKNEVFHQQTPASGSKYLVVKLKITKTGSQPRLFQWNDLKLIDANGVEYSRHPNDSFLEQYNFTPRMTGLDLRLGENAGWMVYEIPEAIAQGPLSLLYSVEDGMLKIELSN